MTDTTLTRTGIDAATVTLVSQFLGREAQLLDAGEEEAWYLLLDDDFTYRVPVRQATEPRSNEFLSGGFRINDTKAHVRTRIDRLNTGIAYSEVPPSRTLRVVGSIVVSATEREDVFAASSALLLYRQRGIDPYFDLIPARREDRLRLVDGELRLMSRVVLMTETSMATPNLAVFL